MARRIEQLDLSEPVLRASIRYIRANLKPLLNSGKPVIVQRHARDAAIVLPVTLPYFPTDADTRKATRKLTTDLALAMKALRL